MSAIDPLPDPQDVRKILSSLILADGFDVIFDGERSHGSWLRDARTGRDYLDFLTFFASSPIGYNHPRLLDPAFVARLQRAALAKPSLSDIYTVEFAHFAQTFRDLAAPSYLPHGFFVEGGALGVENALKTAMDWKVRRNRRRGLAGERGTQIMHFREAFHGRTGYTLSLTNTDPVKTDAFAKFSWPRIPNPKIQFPLTPDEESRVATAEAEALDEMRAVLADRGDDVAAVIIEPIQGEGGDNHFRGELLRAIQKLCRETDCFFIVDEVQTGLGLTGRMWAHEHFDLRPDALAFGKKTQVCGCLVGPRVDEEPDNVFKVSSRLNSTWGGNLVDMVRCARMLAVIHDEGLVDNARVVGLHLLDGLHAIQSELGDVITNVRGRGLMIAFDLATADLRDRARQAMVAHGLLVLGCGERAIRFRPPLNLSVEEADAGCDIVRRSLKSL